MKRLTLLFPALCIIAASIAQSAGDYRTVKSGNWSDVTVWQRYNGTKWVTANAYPVATDGVISILDGNNVTVNLNLTIDQTTVDAGGQLSLNNTSNYTLTLANGAGDDVTVNGLLNDSTGTITGTGKLNINGVMQWSGGSVNCPATNAGILNIETYISTNTVSLYTTLTNNGTINFIIGTINFIGGSIVNNGVFTAKAETYFANNGGGTFTNNAGGVLTLDNYAVLSSYVTFINKGTMNFNTGNFITAYIFTNQKTMSFARGSFQSTYGGTVNLNNGTLITGTGTMVFSGTININTNISVPKNIVVNMFDRPDLTGGGSVGINGDCLWYGGGTVSVPVTIANGATLTISGNGQIVSSTITNNGAITLGVGFVYFAGGSMVNNNIMDILADYRIFNFPGTNSIINNTAGIITKRSAGITTIDVPVTNKGNIAGTGTFNFTGSFANTGTFSPGADTGTSIFATGVNYSNSTLLIKIKGLSPGLNYDRLVVNGNATLKGTLTVTGTGSVAGGADTILTTTGTITGKFKTVNLPAGYTILYKPTRVIIKTPNSLVGDQNDAESLKVNNDDKAISVFPNPATQSVYVNFKSNSKTKAVKIVDANGKTVYEGMITAGNSINISRLAPGTYFLQFDHDKSQPVQFVKQ